MNTNKIDINYNITIKKVPSYFVLSYRKVVPTYYHEGDLWKEMMQYIAQYDIQTSETVFTIYHDATYKVEDVDIELCIVVPEALMVTNDIEGLAFRTVAAEPYVASGMVYGAFENINDAYLSFANWLAEHPSYCMTGISRQIVHKGPWETEKIEDCLTEIQIILKGC